jgi:hypothetical protein
MTLVAIGKALIERSRELNPPGLWEHGGAPRLLTATLDDGWGLGLEVIHVYADAMGMTTRFLGLMKSRTDILRGCWDFRPDLLGLSVLQEETAADLQWIRRQLPPATRMLLGGPLLGLVPSLAEEVGADFVAANVCDFIELGLRLQAPEAALEHRSQAGGAATAPTPR